MPANEQWLVDLKLNTRGFERSAKQAEARLAQIGKNGVNSVSRVFASGSFSSSISNEVKNGISDGAKAGFSVALAGFVTAIAPKIASTFSKSVINSIKKTKTSKFNIPLGVDDDFKANLNAQLKSITSTFNKSLKTISNPASTASSKIRSVFTAFKTGTQIKATLGVRNFAVQLAKIPGLAGIARASFVGLSSAITGLSTPQGMIVTGITALITVLTTAKYAFAGVQAAALGMSRGFLESFAKVEMLSEGLKRVGLNSNQIKDVIALGKLPGLTSEQAATSVARLTASGFGLEEAKALTVAFSKGTLSAEQFSRVSLAISQILNKSELSAEEINQQLGEAVPGFSKLMQKAFGASSAEQLRDMGVTPREFVIGIAKEFNKIPAATSTAQSALDNFDDALERLKASFGKGLAVTALPFMDKLTAKFDELVASGKLEEIGTRFASIFEGDTLTKVIDDLVAVGNAFSYIAMGINKVAGFLANISTFFTSGGILDFLKGIPIIGPLVGMVTGFKKAGDTINAKKSTTKSKLPTTSSVSKVLEGISKTDSNAPKVNQIDQTLNSFYEKQLDILRQIAANTEPKNLERAILGGGNLGAMGVTAVELAGVGGPRKSEVLGVKFVTLLDEMALEIFRAINQANRDGVRAR